MRWTWTTVRSNVNFSVRNLIIEKYSRYIQCAKRHTPPHPARLRLLQLLRPQGPHIAGVRRLQSDRLRERYIGCHRLPTASNRGNSGYSVPALCKVLRENKGTGSFFFTQSRPTVLTELQHDFPSYSGRCHAKMTWPLLLLILQSSECTDGYLARSVEANLRTEFAAQPENVRAAANPAQPPLADSFPIPDQNSSSSSMWN